MKIGSFFPQDDLLPDFVKYSKHTYIEDGTDVDVLLAMSVTQWRRAQAAWRQTGKPLVCHVWDLPTNWRSWCRNDMDYSNNKHRDGEIVRQLDFLALCSKVIACSEHTQGVLHTMGVKSEVCHNFYGGEELDLIIGDREIEKKNRIIQISRYALNKRFHLTLEMWVKIKDKHKDWELMFIGPEGDVLSEIKGTCVKRVTIKNELNRSLLVNLLAESKILVAPSLNEGFGLTPLEARHFGLDVVCADMPWVHEFGYATHIFEPENVDAYAQAVEDAMNPIGFADNREFLAAQKFAERFDKILDKVK